MFSTLSWQLRKEGKVTSFFSFPSKHQGFHASRIEMKEKAQQKPRATLSYVTEKKKALVGDTEITAIVSICSCRMERN